MRWIILLAIGSGITGCSSLTPTENGVLGGGALGGVTGALIGKSLGNTGAGAAIGAGVGAVAGGVTGNAVEQAENKAVARATFQQQQQAARQLGLTDVVQMAQGKVSDPVIIGQIRTTGSRYNLSTTDIQWLKDNGVSDAVVMEMQQTASRPAPVVYARQRPVYVVEEPVFVGPPPPVVGVGFYHGRRW
ncbi:MAG: hypothetical protein K1X57_02700 [Gemmataceae bacterium]|nr:hypothetical protein [Gemmataceae bacterium]